MSTKEHNLKGHVSNTSQLSLQAAQALYAHHSNRQNAATRAAANKGILKKAEWNPRKWQLDCDERRFITRQPPVFDRLSRGPDI